MFFTVIVKCAASPCAIVWLSPLLSLLRLVREIAGFAGISLYAPQITVCPPLLPTHCHDHGPLPITGVGVPTEQSPSVGAFSTVVPWAGPHTPSIGVGGSVTSTCVSSHTVSTVPSFGVIAVTVATLSNDSCTFGSEHVYEITSPGSNDAP